MLHCPVISYSHHPHSSGLLIKPSDGHDWDCKHIFAKAYVLQNNFVAWRFKEIPSWKFLNSDFCLLILARLLCSAWDSALCGLQGASRRKLGSISFLPLSQRSQACAACCSIYPNRYFPWFVQCLSCSWQGIFPY